MTPGILFDWLIYLFNKGMIFSFWTGYMILPGLGQFTLNKPWSSLWSVSCSKQGYASITYYKIANIPSNWFFTTKFIISWF